MRRALVVGIDYYEHISSLHGCVNDAREVARLLQRHSDGSANFGCKTMLCHGPETLVAKMPFKDAVTELFSGDGEVAILYFAGHGHIDMTGGYLCASDCRRGDDGLSLYEIVTIANRSRIHNKILVLDSCYSGVAGSHPNHASLAELANGMTILAASTEEQYATEVNGSGTFTKLFADALGGAAANLVGDVTPGSAYAHVDQSLGSWSQRPVFKTNVQSFVSLRKVNPPIPHSDLVRLVEFFPEAESDYQLDPSFEPERSGSEDPSVPPPNSKNTALFAVLQKYNRVNLVVPHNAPHMWHAAMHSKTVRLTVLGEHYRRLVAQDIL